MQRKKHAKEKELQEQKKKEAQKNNEIIKVQTANPIYLYIIYIRL